MTPSARLEPPQSINENTFAFFDRLTIWFAGMINPARVVATDIRVDHISPICEAEKKRVRAGGLRRGLFPIHDHAPVVFDNPGSFANGARGISAAPVYPRARSNLERRRSGARFAPGRCLFLPATSRSGAAQRGRFERWIYARKSCRNLVPVGGPQRVAERAC